MAIKTYKPYTPSRRHMTGSAFSADLPQAVRQHSKTAASSSAVIFFMGNTP